MFTRVEAVVEAAAADIGPISHQFIRDAREDRNMRYKNLRV